MQLIYALEDFIDDEYVNIRDAETRILEFTKGKEKLVDKNDFNGKLTKNVQFIVIDSQYAEGFI